MELTLLLAKLLGAFSIVMAFSMIARRRMVTKIFDDVFGRRTLSYLLGLAEVAGGLLLVLNHNIWEGTLATVVTILGWLMLLEGVLYVFAKQSLLQRMLHKLHSTQFYFILSFAYLILGIYLLVASSSGV